MQKYDFLFHDSSLTFHCFFVVLFIKLLLMRNILFPFCLFVFFLLFSCQEPNPTKEIDWLLGTWENKTDQGTFTETWIKTNNETKEGLKYNRLEAKSSLVKNGDTLFSEEVILFKMNKWMYCVMASGQNNGKAVTFTVTSMDTNEIVFENPEHDFPKKITYKLINKDSLYAEISGNGKSQGFPFTKIK